MEEDNFQISVKATYTPIDGEEVDLEVDEYVQGSARALIHLLDLATDFVSHPEGKVTWSFLGDLLESPLQRALRESSRAQELTRSEDIQIRVTTQLYSETDTKSTTCSICTEDFEVTTTVSILDCGHVYHESCIREWGRYRPNCPLCRTSIIVEQEEKSEYR